MAVHRHGILYSRSLGSKSRELHISSCSSKCSMLRRSTTYLIPRVILSIWKASLVIQRFRFPKIIAKYGYGMALYYYRFVSSSFAIGSESAWTIEQVYCGIDACHTQEAVPLSSGTSTGDYVLTEYSRFAKCVWRHRNIRVVCDSIPSYLPSIQNSHHEFKQSNVPSPLPTRRRIWLSQPWQNVTTCSRQGFKFQFGIDRR